MHSVDGDHVRAQRRRHPKVRTGCVVCKKRRIKCDETKPKCLRCTKSGWDCEGYNLPRTWLFEPRKSTPESRQDEEEERDEENGQPQQDFSNGASSQAPPSVDIMAAITQAEPVIKHAMFAVVSFHELLMEALTRPDLDLPTYTFRRNLAVRTCSQAIQVLTTAKYPSKTAIIDGIRSFICPRSFEYNYSSLITDLQIHGQFAPHLSKLYAVDDAEAYLNRRFLSLNNTSNHQLMQLTSEISSEPSLDTTPMPLHDLQGAEKSLSTILRQITQLIISNRVTPESIGILEGRLSEWLSGINQITAQNFFDIELLRSMLLLRIQCSTGKILLHTALEDNELVYDNHIQDFQEIDRLYMSVLDADPACLENQKMVVPLLFVATACRDPSIRRSALNMLQKSPNCCMNGATSICERILTIEENSCPGPVLRSFDILPECRVRIAKSTAFFENGVRLRYSRYPFKEDSILEEEFLPVNGQDLHVTEMIHMALSTPYNNPSPWAARAMSNPRAYSAFSSAELQPGDYGLSQALPDLSKSISTSSPISTPPISPLPSNDHYSPPARQTSPIHCISNQPIQPTAISRALSDLPIDPNLLDPISHHAESPLLLMEQPHPSMAAHALGSNLEAPSLGSTDPCITLDSAVTTSYSRGSSLTPHGLIHIPITTVPRSSLPFPFG